MRIIKFLFINALVFSALICKSSDPVFHDFLVTSENDTIYGKIIWKDNINVFVENENGKQKFRADKVNCFQRGAYRYVSIHTKFPEYLREVVSGELSYYVESYIKQKKTIDYIPRCYFKYNEEIIPFILPKVKYNFFSIELNTATGLSFILNEFEYEFSNLKMTFAKIINEESTLYKSIDNGNYTFNDIIKITEIFNSGNENSSHFDTLPKKFSHGYIITLEKDTIYGLVKNENPIKVINKVKGLIKEEKQLKLNGKIKFIDNNGTTSEYGANEIAQFKINDRLYVGHFFKNERRNRKLFLEKVQDGTISLYVQYVNPKSPSIIGAIKKEIPKPTYYDYNLNINGKYYIQKGMGDLVPVDIDYKFLDLFKDKIDIYNRIVQNEYKRFEIESMVMLYNNAP